ncbi:hypothetical protein PIB30_089339 [Stylosanthes scabra]|uniref:Uncharacterized protein n=1 Tax=Stylosanthes scabra TaxID=79078 RepID=A0ABU6VSE2_9FABA|nr:hypothetical protein [Stylosanthes scabra]
MASSSSVSVFDNYRFKTAFNEVLYNTIVKNKKVIAECWFDLDDDEYPRNSAQVEGATTDFETRKEHDQQLDRMLADLYVRAEDIIADKMVRIAQRVKEKGKLGFSSTIYKLCKEAGVPLREFRRTKKIPVEKPITARRMEITRLPRHLQHQQQDNEDEDQPMTQAGEGMKKDKDMNMITTTNQNLTTSQSMSTNKTSKKNHKCSNLHSIKSQPIQTSMRRTCIV